MSEEIPRRKIKLETRYGSSRESRSRKDRPCDVCRGRKSACVITVKPPCRFCETRGIDCTFTSNPRPRRRTDTELSDGHAMKPLPSTPVEIGDERALESESPQASRFPVLAVSSRRGSSSAFLSRSPSVNQRVPEKSGRQYLSLQQLTSSSHDPSPHSPALLTAHHNQTVMSLAHNQLLQDPARHSLEHGRNVTAHFVGLAGEQDTNLFASIRYSILNETRFIDFNITQMYAGDSDRGVPPIHFTVISDTFAERDERVKRQASDAIEAIVGWHGEALIRLYFRFVHPAMPVIAKAKFIASYTTNKFDIPASLRGAVYGLATAYWSQDPSLAIFPPLLQSDIMDHTHTALNRELESPKLATLQACLLVLHEQPDVNGTTESPRIWILACQATACAQSLGLHQDPTAWKLPTWEVRLRKRLWWATVAGDTWTAICHGQTPHIAAGTFNTPSLDIEDLVSDEKVSGITGEHILAEQDRYFNHDNAVIYMQAITLTNILAKLLSSSFTLQSYQSTIQHSEPMQREAVIWQLKTQVDHTLNSLRFSFVETSNANQVSLHLGFYAVKFLIFRALMAPATSESKANPSSRLRYHFDAAMAEAEKFMRLMVSVKSMDLHVFWYRQSRTNLIQSGNFLIYLFFCASTESHVARLYAMLEQYRDILKEVIKDSDWGTIGLLRPSLLRMESFFANAAGAIEQRHKGGNLNEG